jgi:hypothetical protein
MYFLDQNGIWVWNLLPPRADNNENTGVAPEPSMFNELQAGGRYDLEFLALDIARACAARRYGACPFAVDRTGQRAKG